MSRITMRLVSLGVCLLVFAACAGRAPQEASDASQPTPSADSAPPPPSDGPPDPEPPRDSDAPAGEQSPDIQMVEHGTPAQDGIPDTVREAIVGSSWHADSPVALDDLAYLRIPYIDFDGQTQIGEMIVHSALAAEVREIFAELYDTGYPIAGMRLIDEYGADDDLSMAANNAYAFCSRLILGTDRYSQHAYGIAIDINPVQNPYVIQGGTVYPEAARAYLDRDDVRPGMIIPGDACHSAFVSRGWTWAGDWPNPDYQHFEKSLDTVLTGGA